MPAPREVPVALFLANFDSGGSERQLIELARRLDRRRWLVHLVCFSASGVLFERAVDSGATIAAFPLSRLARPATINQMRRFARWCRNRGIAILHTGQLYPNIFGLPASALAGVPVRIASRRNLNTDKTPGQQRAQRWAMRFAHRIVANSGAAAARLRDEGVHPAKIVVIPNGIDASAFQPAGCRASPRAVVSVGNVRAVKGHDVLVRAAALLLPELPDARFLLVGDGPALPAVRALASELGVAHAFTFAGYRGDVAALLAAADIFVLPSRSESTPNALLEAMASGLPVVASAVGGVTEIVEEGRNGLLVPPDDPVALAARLGELMLSPSRSRDIATAARATIAARFSFDRMVASFDELYERALAGTRSRDRV